MTGARQLSSSEIIAAGLGLAVALLPMISVLAIPSRLGLFVFDEQIAAVILACGLAVVFLKMPSRLAGYGRAVDLLLALVSVAFGVALFVRFPTLSEGAFFHPVEAAVFGAFAVVLLVEGMRRVAGWVLTIVFAVLCTYALFGHLLPNSLAGKSLTVMQMLGFLGADSTALLGQTLAAACFIIIPFILFGRLLMLVGASEVFDTVGARLAGQAPGASGRITIISSMLFGTISGSAVANVMANGAVTISMMVRNGYTKEDAAAAEAVSSTGGQIMPPVMGAAAFIMAEYLKVPYTTIMMAGVIPSMLFYGATACQLDFMARRMGLPPYVEDEVKPFRALKIESVLLVLAFVILLGGIFMLNMPPELAAVIATAALSGAAILILRHRGVGWRSILNEVAGTGLASADVLLVCGLAGMIIGMLTTTGLGFTLSLQLLAIGKSSLFLLLVVTAIVSLILGMGMPTTAVYMLLATLAAPTLIQLGISPIGAHMFVFYYGLLSMITPPVALAAFAAASIAGASAISVGWHSVKQAWIAFLVPFLFVYQPAVLMEGGALGIAVVVVNCIVAIPLITGALVGHALAPLKPLWRLVWLALGLLVFVPFSSIGRMGTLVDVLLSLSGIAVVVLHWRHTRRPSDMRGAVPA